MEIKGVGTVKSSWSGYISSGVASKMVVHSEEDTVILQDVEPPMISPLIEKELKIKVNRSMFKDQTGRLVTDLGQSEAEAKIIHRYIRDLVKAKVEKWGKNWSESVCEAVANVIIGILIEEKKKWKK